MSKQECTVNLNYDSGVFYSISFAIKSHNNYFGKTLLKEQAERAANILRINMDFILDGDEKALKAIEGVK